MTWVYFLKSKASEEVLQIFQQFKAFVEKESSALICRFWYNNSTSEYNNYLFKDFLSTCREDRSSVGGQKTCIDEDLKARKEEGRGRS